MCLKQQKEKLFIKEQILGLFHFKPRFSPLNIVQYNLLWYPKNKVSLIHRIKHIESIKYELLVQLSLWTCF